MTSKSTSELSTDQTEEQKRILVLDDSEKIRFILNAFFKSKGLHIQTVADGQEALNILRRDKKFDILLIDISMPNMTGFEFLMNLKELEIDSQICILSGQTEHENLTKANFLGVSEYITKPINLNSLYDKVMHVLKNKHLKTEDKTVFVTLNAESMIDNSTEKLTIKEISKKGLIVKSTKQLIEKNIVILNSTDFANYFQSKKIFFKTKVLYNWKYKEEEFALLKLLGFSNQPH